ncbi:hypothetical protein BDB01DRAFT_831909 [Pilobolus umbonatus]|nr:hypothetical protein BDB01DRAFT_831909 [Pilobolus umbonatus]
MTMTHPSHQLNPNTFSDIRLRDIILNKEVGLDEWISNEITRLRNNSHPRHCVDFAQLTDYTSAPAGFQLLMVHYSGDNRPRREINDNTIVGNAAKENPKLAFVSRAILELMKYCSRSKSVGVAPKALLVEFRKIHLQVRRGQTIDPCEINKRLSSILFDKVKLTNDLIQYWKILCQWVTCAPLIDHGMKWVHHSLSAFVHANKVFMEDSIV